MFVGLWNKIKKILKYPAYYLRGLFIEYNGVVILMYHSIDNNDFFFNVFPSDFENQIRYLKENNFNVITFDDLKECLDKNQIQSKSIILTFDDGYRDNYLKAFPILKKYNLPATVFVSTGLAGENRRPNMLDWSEMKEMHASGLIDIEPHTVSHPKLTHLAIEKARREILDSKSEIERHLDKKCKVFAYPYGNCSDSIVEMVDKSGFDFAVTVHKGIVKIDSNRLKLNRNSVDSEVDLFQFKNIVTSGRI